jgi:hypothetical protein
MSDAYDMTLVFALLALIAGLALWCLWNAGRIAYQWYRDNRPRRMATRTTVKPFDDDRSSQRNFKRMMRS